MKTRTRKFWIVLAVLGLLAGHANACGEACGGHSHR
jgi:hypothetical protein